MRARELRDGGLEHPREHVLARVDQPQQLLDRRRLLLHAVRVVGRIAEQRVGQLGLAAQDRLGPGGLADGAHAGGRERADLGARVEARAVHVPVAAAVAGLDAGLAHASSSTARMSAENGPS